MSSYSNPFCAECLAITQWYYAGAYKKCMSCGKRVYRALATE